MKTIFEAYKEALEKLDNATKDEINVRILLCYINKLSSMSEFYIKKDEEVHSIELFEKLFNRYLNGEPIQYLTNEVSFLNETFYVDNRVLIPRMETEEVAIYTINKIKSLFNDRNIEIIDVCSGSGCLGLTIAKNVNCSKLFLSDISKDAIEVSMTNTKKLFDIKRTNFIVSDGLVNLLKNKKCHPNVIVSNPPYIINRNNVDESVLKYEPSIALFTDENISIYKQLINDAVKFKNRPLLIVFEISDEVYPLIKEFLNNNYSKEKIEYIKDINNKWRIASILLN